MLITELHADFLLTLHTALLKDKMCKVWVFNIYVLLFNAILKRTFAKTFFYQFFFQVQLRQCPNRSSFLKKKLKGDLSSHRVDGKFKDVVGTLFWFSF